MADDGRQMTDGRSPVSHGFPATCHPPLTPGHPPSAIEVSPVGHGIRRFIGSTVAAGAGCALLLATALVLGQEPKDDGARRAQPAPAPAPAAETVRQRLEHVRVRREVIHKQIQVLEMPKAAPVPLVEIERLLPDVLRGADPQRDALSQQFTQQYRPVLRVELQLARSACDLTDDQRLALSKAGDRLLKDTVAKFVDQQLKMMRGQWRGGPQLTSPFKILRDGVADAVKEHLTPEQYDRFQAEVEAREANRKRVAVRNLVLQLDRDLALSEDQRERLCHSIASHWNENWDRWTLETFQNGSQFYPNIPDQAVSPYLTRAQKDLWRGMLKNNNVFYTGGGINANLALDADPLGVEPPDPPPNARRVQEFLKKAAPVREKAAPK
jgi:hypothetical protein